MGFGFATTAWYKVRHPYLDPNRAYRAVGYVLPSETAWGHLVFITETGHTFAIQVWRCTALMPSWQWAAIDPSEFSRELSPEEYQQPWAEKPQVKNPDLQTDL